ncbi:class I SAM-dependent methyltransferase [Candidatus Electronema sp. TJ]|uniref:class I SAM-dependent methyltransferase n=1 Tax=Candidatus Electronema sp. TJ TaxID=3401573 RepID=UPI003AA88F97
MTVRAAHWDAIFSSKQDAELGWHEKDVSQTLKFLDLLPQTAAAVFLPGAGTSLLVDALSARGYALILNDISAVALQKLRERRGEHEQITLLHHDIAQPLSAALAGAADLWIDRAVLHFLLQEEEIQGYFANLRSVLRPGGHVLLAEFSTAGAAKCAGLELHRYSIAEMSLRLGNDFTLIAAEEHTYINPSGQPRPYVYGLFARHS